MQKRMLMNKSIGRKIGAFSLIFSMLMTSFPAQGIFAEEAPSSANAFEALGIDSSKKPDSYDQQARNPYGKDVVAINPVEELYIAGAEETAPKIDPIVQEGSSPLENSPMTTEELGKLYNENLLKNLQVKKKTQTLPKEYSFTVYGEGIMEDKSYIFDNAISYPLPYSGTIENTYLAFNQSESQVDDKNAYLKRSLRRAEGDNPFVLSAMAAGTFDDSRLDKSGKNGSKKAQVAIVYTSALDKNGGLYLRIRDILSGEQSEPIELMSTAEVIGNPQLLDKEQGSPYEDFSRAPYLLQNYLKVSTGDYDGDGIDEIAVYVPKKGDSKIVVYKLGRTSGGDKQHLDKNRWQKDWTYSLQETSYTSNMVSLTSGDFNRDGIDDLAGTWGYYYGPEENQGSKAVVMFGDVKDRLQQSRQFDLNYQGSNLVRGAFTYGDFFSKGTNLLVFGGQSDADIKAKNLNTRYVCAYVWDGKDFKPRSEKNFDLFAKNKEGDLLYPAMAGGDFLSMPLTPANIAVVKQEGEKPSNLYFDSLLIGSAENGFSITKRLDLSDSKPSEKFVEYQAASADMVGKGQAVIAMIRQSLAETKSAKTTRRKTTTEKVQVPIYREETYYANWFYRLLGIASRRQVIDHYEEKEVPSGSLEIEEQINYISTLPKNQILVFSGDASNTLLNKKDADISAALCMANTDEDTSFIRYTGDHFFSYADPKVLAVLASPPYFEDLMQEGLSGKYDDAETSYTSSKGQGSSESKSTSIRAGAYLSYEQDISIFGIKAASFETELSYGLEATFASEKANSMEQAITYTANAGSDTVVLYSMPIEVFVFEVYRPDSQGNYQSVKIRRNIPHPAAVRTMDLEKYQEIQKDFKGVLPDISADVFTHSLGDPATYPSSLPREGGSVGKVVSYTGEPVGVGFSASGSAITQEISMSEEESKHYELVHDFDFKIGAGAGGFTAGTSFGVSTGGGTATITTSGSSFSGTLQAMPIEAEGYGYGHLWKIFSYQYNKDKMSFPVVNYMVTNVNRPAPLPTDFAQDVEQSTDKTAVLTWSYDKPVTGFQLYNYNKYPDGAGIEELAYVPFTQGQQRDGKYFFEYRVENLSPYTDYQFKIQTIRSTVPQKSIPSQTLSVKTKTQNGYPDIKIRNLTEKTDIENGKIALYPDADLEIQAYIAGSTENYRGLNYQWQKKDASGQWQDLSGKTESTLRFKRAGYADRGLYRCRINLRYFDPTAQKEFYISSYSGELTANYQKRPIDLGSGGLFASAFNTGSMKGVNASVELVSASAGHYTAPTGQVRFLLTGVDYRQEKVVKLNTNGNVPQNSKNVAKAETSFENLKDGVYQLSLSYLGDSIFASQEIGGTKTAVVGNTAGKIAYLSDGKNRKERFLYGDAITASVSEVSESAETPSEESYNYTLYKYKDHAFWQQKSKKSEHRDQEGSLSQAKSWNFAPANQTAGYYLLHVENADQSWSNDIFFSIERRKIHLRAEDKKASQGNVGSVDPTFLIEPESALVGSDDLTADIQYEFYNSSGKKVDNFGDQTDPGNYRVKIGIKESSAYHQKYEFSFTDGLYTIVGRAFRVTLEAEKIGSLIAGSVKADEFGGNSGQVSAGTPLHLTASPSPGYAVDRWEVYEENNSDTPVNQQIGGNLFTHTLTSANTRIVVRFKKVGYGITVYQPKSGGKIKNVNGTEFPDGVTISVAKGSRFEFRAEPAEGYSFKRWNISPNTTDVVLDTKGDTVKIAAAKTNIQIRAEFERDKYRLHLGDHIGAYHMHDHDDNTATEKIKKEILSGESVSKDEEVFCYLMPGYQKAEGARWQIDGKDQDDSMIVGDELKIAADSVSGKEILVTLTSAKKNLEIRAKAAKIEANEVQEAADRGSIAVKVNDILISDPEALKNIAGSSKVVFEAKAAHGFRFSHWRVNGEVLPGSDPIYTIPQLAETAEVFAVMEEEEAHSVTVTIHPPDKAKPKYILTDRYGETVADESFTSGSDIPVFKGDSLRIALELDPYTIVDQWQIGDRPLAHNDPEHSLTDIRADQQVHIHLTATTEHELTIGTEGAAPGEKIIAKAGSQNIYEGTDTQIVKVPGGTRLLFTAEGLSEDRSIIKWSINGEDYPSIGNSHEFFVNKNAAIVAHFGAFDGYTLSIPREAESVADIEVQSAPDLLSSGKIEKNAKLTFTITPKEGYLLDQDGIRLLQGKFDSIEEQDGKWIAVIEQVDSDVILQLSAHKRLQIFMRENGTDALPGTGEDTLRYTGGSVQLSIEGKELRRGIAGDTINLSVFSESRYRLESIKVYGKETAAEIPLTQSGSGYTFTAPSEDVAVEAKFLYIYVPPAPSPSPSPSPSPKPPEDKPKEDAIDLPKAMDDSEQIEEKTTTDPNKEWVVTLNLNLSGLDEREVFLLDENGKVQEATIQINIHAPNQFIVRPKEAYADGKRYYIYIRKDGLLSENGGKLRRDVLFSFIYQK